MLVAPAYDGRGAREVASCSRESDRVGAAGRRKARCVLAEAHGPVPVALNRGVALASQRVERACLLGACAVSTSASFALTQAIWVVGFS